MTTQNPIPPIVKHTVQVSEQDLFTLRTAQEIIHPEGDVFELWQKKELVCFDLVYDDLKAVKAATGILVDNEFIDLETAKENEIPTEGLPLYSLYLFESYTGHSFLTAEEAYKHLEKHSLDYVKPYILSKQSGTVNTVLKSIKSINI